MGNTNSNEKIIYGGIIASTLVLSSVGLAVALKEGGIFNNQANLDKELENIQHSPNFSLLQQIDDEELLKETNGLILKMVAMIYAVKEQENGNLETDFFAALAEFIYLVTKTQINKIIIENKAAIIQNIKTFNFNETNKGVKQLAYLISEIEEKFSSQLIAVLKELGDRKKAEIKKDEITPTDKLIIASRIFCIKHKGPEMTKMLLKGCPSKLQDNLKVINEFSVKDICAFLKIKIDNRKKQGFEYVDKGVFPQEFGLQIALETEAKFGVPLDEFWAYCHQENALKGEEKEAFDELFEGYCSMILAFYHSLELFKPGIKVF